MSERTLTGRRPSRSTLAATWFSRRSTVCSALASSGQPTSAGRTDFVTGMLEDVDHDWYENVIDGYMSVVAFAQQREIMRDQQQPVAVLSPADTAYRALSYMLTHAEDEGRLGDDFVACPADCYDTVAFYLTNVHQGLWAASLAFMPTDEKTTKSRNQYVEDDRRDITRALQIEGTGENEMDEPKT